MWGRNNVRSLLDDPSLDLRMVKYVFVWFMSQKLFSFLYDYSEIEFAKGVFFKKLVKSFIISIAYSAVTFYPAETACSSLERTKPLVFRIGK